MDFSRKLDIAPSDKNCSVLLVDDILEIRFLVRMLLANVMRCQVIAEAGNGAEAVELARELQPNIVVLDVEMPVMT